MKYSFELTSPGFTYTGDRITWLAKAVNDTDAATTVEITPSTPYVLASPPTATLPVYTHGGTANATANRHDLPPNASVEILFEVAAAPDLDSVNIRCLGKFTEILGVSKVVRHNPRTTVTLNDPVEFVRSATVKLNHHDRLENLAARSHVDDGDLTDWLVSANPEQVADMADARDAGVDHKEYIQSRGTGDPTIGPRLDALEAQPPGGITLAQAQAADAASAAVVTTAFQTADANQDTVIAGLQGAIAAETNARTAAITAEQTARTDAVAAEATARTAADTAHGTSTTAHSAANITLDDTPLGLPGTPTTVQAGFVAMKSLVDGLPDAGQVNTFADLPVTADSGSMLHVIDASGDPTVTAGWARYQFLGGTWLKILSAEQLAAGGGVALTDVQVADPRNAAHQDITGTVTTKQLADLADARRFDWLNDASASAVYTAVKNTLVQLTRNDTVTQDFVIPLATTFDRYDRVAFLNTNGAAITARLDVATDQIVGLPGTSGPVVGGSYTTSTRGELVQFIRGSGVQWIMVTNKPEVTQSSEGSGILADNDLGVGLPSSLGELTTRTVVAVTEQTITAGTTDAGVTDQAAINVSTNGLTFEAGTFPLTVPTGAIAIFWIEGAAYRASMALPSKWEPSTTGMTLGLDSNIQVIDTHVLNLPEVTATNSGRFLRLSSAAGDMPATLATITLNTFGTQTITGSIPPDSGDAILELEAQFTDQATSTWRLHAYSAAGGAAATAAPTPPADQAGAALVAAAADLQRTTNATEAGATTLTINVGLSATPGDWMARRFTGTGTLIAGAGVTLTGGPTAVAAGRTVFLEQTAALDTWLVHNNA